MSYRYINSLASPENLNKFLELVDLAGGAGKNPKNVFQLGDKLSTGLQMQLCTQAIQKDPASAKMLEERYVGPPHDLKTLLAMPKGSLGWTYARVLSAIGYEPFNLTVPTRFETDGAYINFRVFKTHDIHHVMTGYSLDTLGELGVISVFVGQIRYPAFLFLDLVSLLLGFFTSDKLYDENMEVTDLNTTLGYKFRLISDGIEIAQAAKPLFPIKWEEGFERPLEEWRQELNVKPVMEGPYSWYTNPKIKAALEA
ncbi:Coq4 family protein [Chlorogloeopsis fritschii]|uniref:Coq4 family protein n=1 Tax=Chlorogloeopsis fritschii TaxID=1124 RepID=UPI00370D8E8D